MGRFCQDLGRGLWITLWTHALTRAWARGSLGIDGRVGASTGRRVAWAVGNERPITERDGFGEGGDDKDSEKPPRRGEAWAW